jgi:hypothetical protein
MVAPRDFGSMPDSFKLLIQTYSKKVVLTDGQLIHVRLNL